MTEDETMYDVFISYQKADKTFADAVCAKLEEHDIKCWIAPRDISPGDTYADVIIDAINSSRIMILIFSSHSNASPSVLREVQRAADKGTTIIPYRIEQVEPTRGMQYYLGPTQWFDAMSPPFEHNLDKLVETVRKILRFPSQSEAPSESIQQPISPPPVHKKEEREFFKIRRNQIVTGIVGFIVILIVIGVAYSNNSNSSTGPLPTFSNSSRIAGAAPPIRWVQMFGGNGNNSGRSVQQTNDGGYIIAGTTNSFSVGKTNVYLVKTDSFGMKQWEQTFGGTVGNSTGRSVKQTTDGGYIIAGQTDSFSAGKLKAYLIKTDSSGNKQWEQTYGGNAFNVAASVQLTTDGGYIFVGSTSVDKTLSIYLAKTDPSGKVQWEQTFGSGDQNAGTSVRQTSDGNYIIAGTTIQSRDQAYVYLAKTDSSGKVQWYKQFGGRGTSAGTSVQLTKDGGYIIGGSTNATSDGKMHFYLVKTDSSGTMQWQQTYGLGDVDLGYAVQQTQDLGYIIGGSVSFTTNNRTQAYLVKSDSSGSMQWQETLGGSANTAAYDVRQTTDSGYIVVGLTDSGHANQSDVYLAKL